MAAAGVETTSFVFRAAGDAQVAGVSNKVIKALDTVGKSYQRMQGQISKVAGYLRFAGFGALGSSLGGRAAGGEGQTMAGDIGSQIAAFYVYEKFASERFQRMITLAGRNLKAGNSIITSIFGKGRIGTILKAATSFIGKYAGKVLPVFLKGAIKVGVRFLTKAVGGLLGAFAGPIGFVAGIIVGEVVGAYIGKAIDWLWDKAAIAFKWVGKKVGEAWNWIRDKAAKLTGFSSWSSTRFDTQEAMRQRLPEERTAFRRNFTNDLIREQNRRTWQFRWEDPKEYIEEQRSRFNQLFTQENNERQAQTRQLLDALEFERRN